MTTPRRPTVDEIGAALDAGLIGETFRQVYIGGPEEGPDVIECPALVDGTGVAVLIEIDEVELARLANGGRLWLRTWGGLPIHRHEVVGP